MVLEIGDSVLTHRRQFSISASHNSVIRLMALDPLNPRSIAFQLAQLQEEIGELPGNEAGQLSQAAKDVLNLHAKLATSEAGELQPDDFHAIVAGLGDLSDSLSRGYFV